VDELGLFPLGLVLLPNERLPLHVFEDRYIELVGECIEQGTEFGFVYTDDKGVREVGTRARITEVLTRFEDGRMNILVEGGERFRLDELTDGRSFATANVSAMDDDSEIADPSVVDEALRTFGVLRELTDSDVDVPDSGRRDLSFALAAKIELPPGEKLALLREPSERRRMDMVVELLDEAVLTAQRVRRASRRATTNGRVDLG
jgi:Lon protease-like protein